MIVTHRALRLDDLGASSKQWERWSRHRWANVWPLHHRRLFGAWGPYRELTADELETILRIVKIYRAPMTVAITACWVEQDGSLTPYGEKFPRQARLIGRWAQKQGLQVAAHGLTHCVPGQHLPRWIGGNRPWHRERDYSVEAIAQLAADLEIPVQRYIPPGEPAGTTNEFVFHDRDFVLDWTGAMRKLHEALR